MNPIDWVTDAAGSAIGGAGDAVLDALVARVEEALAYVSRAVADALAALAAPDFGSAAFAQLGGTFKWLALISVLGTIMLSCGGALLNSKVELAQVVREIPITMLMLAGWYSVTAMWFEACRTLTGLFVGDALAQSLQAGIALDVGIASFLRMFICLFMMLFLIIFLVEMFVLQHLMTFAAVVGPLAISLRPWPALKDVSGRMIRNVVTMSLTPALTAASMSLAVRNVNDAGILGMTQAIGGLAGMAVSVFMPVMVAKFLPLGGSGDSGGRALIGAAAGIAGVAAGAAATGGASVAAQGASRLASFKGKS